MDSLDTIDDLFLEIELPPVPEEVALKGIAFEELSVIEKATSSVVEEFLDVIEGTHNRPEPAIDQQNKINEERALANIELTKEERLTKVAESLGLNACDYEEDDAFLSHVVLEYKVILGLYMTGKSPTEIARQIKSTTYRVNKVLSSPENLNIINHWKNMVEIELDGLLPLAIDAVRKGLLSHDQKVSLLAVDKFIKLRGEGQDRTGMTVQIVNDSRHDFIEGLRDLAERKGLLNGKFREVKEVEDASVDANP